MDEASVLAEDSVSLLFLGKRNFDHGGRHEDFPLEQTVFVGVVKKHTKLFHVAGNGELSLECLCQVLLWPV